MDAPLHDSTPYEPAQRVPPHNFQCEKALLGAVMANNTGIMACVDAGLRPEHFADPIHGRVYDAILGLLSAPNGLADPITLRQFFEHDGSLQDVGGVTYLAELAASLVSIVNIGAYAELIVDLARKRDLLEIGERIVSRAYSPAIEDDADKQIADAERALSRLAETQTAGMPQDPDSQIARTVQGIEAASKGKIIGRSTGLVAFDHVIGALMPGNLYIVGARPSMGKTALGLSLADAGGDAFFWSGEMPAEQCHSRRIAQRAKIPSNRFYRPRDINNVEFDRIYAASTDLDRSVHIDDTPGLTIGDFRRRVLRFREHHPLGLVVADHLGKFSFLDPRGKPVDELGKISGGLKNLAKELGVPVVLLVQLNRAVEGRDDKRPQLSDLRDSGRIEEDADVVGFLYREAYYLSRMPPAQKPNESDNTFLERQADHEERLKKVRHLAEIGLGKNRHGPTDTIRLYWNDPLMLFGNLMRDEPAPGARDQGGMEL